MKKIRKVAYKVMLLSSICAHLMFHMSALQKYHADDIREHDKPLPPPPIIIEGNNEFEVKEVLDMHMKYQKCKYLIKWKGYKLHDAI